MIVLKWKTQFEIAQGMICIDFKSTQNKIKISNFQAKFSSIFRNYKGIFLHTLNFQKKK